MYAVPARVGVHRIIITFPCHECGGTLYFSHDEIRDKTAYRYASCDKNHTMFFIASVQNTQPIPVDNAGYLIDDSSPGWESQIPQWLQDMRAA